MKKEYRKSRIRDAGFSMLELIVVIAMMAVLVTVLTVSFLRYVEKSKAAVCAENRDAITREIMAEYISDSSQDFATIYNIIMNAHTGESKCPSGGTYGITITGASYSITCSEHKDEEAMSLGDATNMAQIVSIFNIGTTTGRVDSNASNVSAVCNTALVKKQFADAGIDLDKMGAKTWAYIKGNDKSFLYWTPVDITSYAVGEKLPVIVYNTQSGNYTVWTVSVKTGTTSTHSQTESEPYNCLNESGKQPYLPSTSNQNKQTYEDALQFYEDAVQEMNKQQSGT